MSNHSEAMQRYRAYMKEIRFRIDVINRVLDELQRGGAITGYRESDIELVYLQFRHCLELMMFASLSAHQSFGHSLSQKLIRKEYSATKILKFIKTKNTKFYPQPNEPEDFVRSDGAQEMAFIKEGFLTQDEFISLYDKTCGNMLHAKREEKFKDNHAVLVNEAVQYRDKLIKLLNCHMIQLTDEIILKVFMVDSSNGEVGVYMMKKIQ